MKNLFLFIVLLQSLSISAQVHVGGRIGYFYGSFCNQGLPKNDVSYALLLDINIGKRLTLSVEPSIYKHGYSPSHTTFIRNPEENIVTGSIYTEWTFELTYLRLPIVLSYDLIESEKSIIVRPFFGIGYGGISNSNEDYYFRQIDNDSGRITELFFNDRSGRRPWMNESELFTQAGIKIGYRTPKNYQFLLDFRNTRGITVISDEAKFSDVTTGFGMSVSFLLPLQS